MSAKLDLGQRPDGAPFLVDAGELDYHAHIMGPTGYGKTYLMKRMFQELALKTDSALFFIDPDGDAFQFLKRWCYQHGLNDRLLIIDPGEQRLVCGFNPLRPWPENEQLQAAIGLEVFLKSLGNEAFANAPLMARWMFNTFYGLISSKQTLYEAPLLLDFVNPQFRDAITSSLAPSGTRTDFEWLGGVLSRSSESQLMRIVNEQLSSSLNRVRQYTRNPYLKLMLATTETAIDWQQVFDRRMIVLVNLQERRVLSGEDQRMFGMQLVSEICQEAFRREKGLEDRVPAYLFIDECHRFASPEIAKILNRGRKFLLRLVLAHQYLSQLQDRFNPHDRQLLDAVMACTHFKAFFGGCTPDDMEQIGKLVYWHHLDPDKRKLEIKTWVQLVRESRRTTYMDNAGGGTSRMRGDAGAAGRAFDDMGELLGTTSNAAYNAALANMESWSSGSANVPFVEPLEPFEQLSSVQFEDLNEQLYRRISRCIRLSRQEGLITCSKQLPEELKVAWLEEPKLDVHTALEVDLDVMRESPYYAEPQQIEREIESRHGRLLPASSAEPVPESVWETTPPARAPQRRRSTARKSRARS